LIARSRPPDQHDAYCIAAWLSRADRNGILDAFLKPDLTPQETTVAGAVRKRLLRRAGENKSSLLNKP